MADTEGRTLTVFLMGTMSRKGDWRNYDFSPTGELVSALLHDVQGEKNIDYAYANGPATTGPDLFCGDYNEDNDYDEYTDRNERWAKPTDAGFFKQILRGNGIEENLNHVLAVIRGKREWWPEDNKTRQQPRRPSDLEPVTRVTVIGWSRGGVAPDELANKIYDAQQTAEESDPIKKVTEINICAIEPTPGWGGSHAKNTKLPPLVKNYLGIYALDERSFGFTPIFPLAGDPKTKLNCIFMPGHHATLVGSDKSRKGKEVKNYDLRAVGEIVRDLTKKFLYEHGTKFKTMQMYTRDKLLDLYAKVKKNLPGYEGLKGEAYTINQLTHPHRKFIVHGKWHNVAASELPAFVADEKAREQGYVNGHHAQLAKEQREALFGDYASHVEYAQKIEYKLNEFIRRIELSQGVKAWHGDRGCSDFLKNLFCTRRVAQRKAACEEVTALISAFIKKLSGARLQNGKDEILADFSKNLKQCVHEQLKEINREYNFFRSEFAELLKNLLLKAPWENDLKTFKAELADDKIKAAHELYENHLDKWMCGLS